MTQVRDCASDIAVPSSPSPRPAPDILRKERFGALLYRRFDCSSNAVPPAHARLLVEAQQRSILEVYAQQGGLPELDDQGFAEQVAGWRAEGLLDGQYRTTARVVEGRRDHGALSAPLVTHVELTRACNLRCAHCYMQVSSQPGPDELDSATLLQLFAELETLGAPLLVLAGGEPLLRPDLAALLDGLARHQLDTWLCTNATLIDAERARQLVDSAIRGYSVSLDGPDATSHDRLRGRGQFARACQGVAALIGAGARDVKLRVTVTADGIDRMVEFAPLARELGVQRVVFKPFSQLGEASSAEPLNPDRERYAQATLRAAEAWPADAPVADFADGIPTRAPSWLRVSPRFGCIAGTTSVTVAHDGRVLGCGCVRPADAWSLRDHSLAECWQASPSVQAWRELVPGASCRSCEKLSSCAGACRARALASGGIQDPDPWMGCS